MRRSSASLLPLAALLAVAALAGPPIVSASDHNEPAPDPVWRADQALHAEWDISDLFAWHDAERDTLDVIVAWHPQQLPRSAGQRTAYNDQVLYEIHLRYEREGAQVFSDDELERVISFRYGENDAGEWGVLVKGMPGLDAVVESCESQTGWREYSYAVDVGDDATVDLRMATGMFDDPFVFDLDGYNASLKRAFAGEVGLKFDPENDTFAGHNATAFVVSLPMTALEAYWEDFATDGGAFGLAPTNEIHVWATTSITADEAAREDGED